MKKFIDTYIGQIQLSTIGDFIKNSFTSILLIVLLLILLTQMAQGSVLVVDLLHHHPISFLLAVFLIGFMSLIVGHYPVYFGHYRNARTDKVNQPYWIVNDSLRCLGFGIIYYVPKKRHDTPNDSQQNNSDKAHRYKQKSWIQTGRRLLGVFVYVMWIYVLLFCWQKYFMLDFNLLCVILLVIFFYWWYYLRLAQVKMAIKKRIKSLNDRSSADTIETIKKEIQKFNRWYKLSIWVTFLLAFLAAYTIYVKGWSPITLYLVLATTFVQAVNYIHFILGRSFFVYSHYKNTTWHNALKLNPYLIPKEKETKPNRILYLGNFSNNAFYVEFFRIAGFILLVFLFFVNARIQQTLQWNPIPILLAYLILAYSLVTIAIKHLMYYRQTLDEVKAASTQSANKINTVFWQKHQTYLKVAIPILLAIVPLGFALDNRIDNDLHTIQTAKETNVIDFETFKSNFQSSQNQNTNIYVSSFGGGLKANLWTLLVLNKLETKSKQNFVKRTVAMSGVSGGGVGISNYAALSKNFSNQDSIRHKINEMGNTHVLSIDGAYFLGLDFVREVVPKKLGIRFEGKDRAYEKMRAYNTVTQKDENDNGFMEQTFREYWHDLYVQKRANQSLFPALLVNSISTHGQYGVASSVKIHKDDFFPGAIDILTYNNDSSLTFSGAVSTTNRFPIFSPTARITEKGNFLDGGYFENSGLLSLMHFRKLMHKNNEKRNRDVIVSIINSKEQYIGFMLEKLVKESVITIKESPSSELGAIFKTLADTDSWPNTLLKQIEYDFTGTEDTLIRIFLPHYIHYHEVETLLKGSLSSQDQERIMKVITVNNAKVIAALDHSATNYNRQKWGVSEPALARLLSEPDVEYQKSMIAYHVEVQAQLERILKCASCF